MTSPTGDGDTPSPQHHPGAWPLLGHLLELRKRPIDLFQRVPGSRSQFNIARAGRYQPRSEPNVYLPPR